ncbi:hypothetical protein TTHERM_00622840 (macronuclear) [Tetrahymena thermophila SB210]|uniref:MSP domain-containing protein n=1 Tax=Tetrahymena thermophila (strain SB210) TaxID=312017 RepID=Q241A0_TETTS|nr:hypothetical protein TTHERM_00622840 [Tetrahymena thermophila SB210]EAS02264.2 hypothetical protein TTHERM_00622840 [Tetrahymena thermophila SB210]|eukprot:XP_001022509.2 hypothetical protein TTHERM_00622840 [Tetrahymena thermophila SB210]
MLLQFNPEQFLDFQVAANKIPTTKLTIRNVSKNQVLFRIIPESNSIKLSKSYGILYEQEQTRISIYLNISKKRIEDIYQKKIIVEYIQYLGTENWEPTDFMNRSKGEKFQKHELEVVINNIGSAVSFVTQESQEFEQKIKASQLYQNQNQTDIDFTKLDYQSFCEENQKNFEIQEEYVENLNILKQLNSEERKIKQENQSIQAVSGNKLSQFSEIKGADMVHSFKPQNVGQNNINLELQNGLGTLNSSRHFIQNPMLNSLNMQASESEFQTGNFGTVGIKADNFQEMITSQKQLQIKEKQMQQHEQKNKQQLSQYARNDEQLANSSREEEKHNSQVPSQTKEKINFFSHINNKNMRDNPQIVFNQQQNLNAHNHQKSNSLTDINQFIQNNSELIKDKFSKSTLIQQELRHEQNKKLHNLNGNQSYEQHLDPQLNSKNNFPTSQKMLNLKTNQKIISANQSHSEKNAVVGNEIGPDESNNNLMQFDHYQSEHSENVLSDNLSDYKQKRERKNSENVSILESEHLNEDIANIPYSQREITEKNKIDQRDNQYSGNRQSFQNLYSDQKNTSNSSFEYQSIHYGSVNQFKEYSGYDNTSLSQNYASFQQEQLNSSRQQNVANNQGLIQNQKLQLENEFNEFSVIGEEQSHQDKESDQQIQNRPSTQSNISKNGTTQQQSHDIVFDQQFNYEKQKKKQFQFSSLQDVEPNNQQQIITQSMNHLAKYNRLTLGTEGIHKFHNSQLNDDKNSNQIFNLLDPIKKNNLESNNQLGSSIKLETPKRNSILEIQSQIHKRQFSQDQNDAFDTDSQKAGYWKEKYEIAAKKESQYKKSIEEQKQTLQFLKSDINKLEFLHRMEKPLNTAPQEKIETNQAKFQAWHLIFLAIASAIFGFMMKKLTL